MGGEHGVVVVVVVETAVQTLDATQLRHPRRDMRSLIDTGRAPIALSIQWWGLRAMSVRAGWGVAEQEEEEGQDRQSTYYVRVGALRSVAFARRVTAARVEGSWTGCWSRARRPFSLLWVGTTLSVERHQSS